MSRRIHTTTKALPRRSSASFCRLSVRAVSGSVEVDRPLFRHSRVSGNPGISVTCPLFMPRAGLGPAFAGRRLSSGDRVSSHAAAPVRQQWIGRKSRELTDPRTSG
jgi:hypothetical protein